jgi:hypothetical protein
LVLEVEEAHNMNFKHVGDLARLVSFAHIAMTVNVTKHIDLVREMCYIPRALASSNTEDKKTARLASAFALTANCSSRLWKIGSRSGGTPTTKTRSLGDDLEERWRSQKR